MRSQGRCRYRIYVSPRAPDFAATRPKRRPGPGSPRNPFAAPSRRLAAGVATNLQGQVNEGAHHSNRRDGLTQIKDFFKSQENLLRRTLPMRVPLSGEACAHIASMIVLLALMAYGGNGNGVTVIDLEKCAIARVTKRDQEFSPAGILLELRLSAGEWRVGQ